MMTVPIGGKLKFFLTFFDVYVGSKRESFSPNFCFLFGVTRTMESGDIKGGAGEPSLACLALIADPWES